MADWVGACTATLAPLTALIEAHVMAAARIHGDDTTVPVLAKGKTVTGRLWTYVRDGQPFGGPEPPAAIFYYSRDRRGEHPNKHLAGYAGILQADAYAGFNDLYHPGRRPGPLTEAGCWAHGRRKLFDLAKVARAPLAAEAVRRIDAIFDVERSINGLLAEQRLALRQTHVAPLVADLETWMRAARGKMSRNAAERALRGIALGRKAWLFAGSDRGGDRAAAMYSLIITALCCARHKALYADWRTMPSGAGRRRSFDHICGPLRDVRSNSIRHSSACYSASRNASRRSLG